MSNLLKASLNTNNGKDKIWHFTIPSSKPETQRAILVASLANGTSFIKNDLRCSETEVMKKACRAFGARIIEHPDHLEIHGVAGKLRAPNSVVDCQGSGLVFRVFTALACFADKPVIISGDEILRSRIMDPLFVALKDLGANLETICSPGKAPIANWISPLKGGKCHLPGNISSQFITAILFAAPFAKEVIEIIIEPSHELYSRSYIEQTVHFIRAAGIKVETSYDYKYFKVYPGTYNPINLQIKEDYTSASYLFVASALKQGKTTFHNVYGNSLQGERAILDILKNLGINFWFNDHDHTLTIENPYNQLSGNYQFDAKDFPNIVPTLAVLGSYIKGTFRVTGAALTRFHKASRVEAITTELTKLGVDIEVIYDDTIPDGFEVRGQDTYKGGVTFSSWQDHRIFMSLFINTLRTKEPCYFEGFEDVHCSFPEFFQQFAQLGIETEQIKKPHQQAA